MKKSCLMGTLYTCVFTLITTSTYAAFFGRLETSPGSGIYQAYYDDQLEITWTADANINGDDTWENQVAWAASLNINGVTGWRLPNMDIPGNDVPVDCAVVLQDSCRGNEYGHLFYYGAGTILRNGITPTNPGPFNSVQAGGYWSSNTLPSDPDKALGFDFIDGIFFIGDKAGNEFAWAVHDGDVAGSPMPVTIDIKPGSDPNSINLSSSGVIPVAILSGADFDASTVAPESVSLAGASVKLVGKSDKYLCNLEDVNSDGLLDLVCKIYTAQFMVEEGETTAMLEAETFDGIKLRGEDSIMIVPDN